MKTLLLAEQKFEASRQNKMLSQENENRCVAKYNLSKHNEIIKIT